MKFVDAPPAPDRSRTGAWTARLSPLRDHPGQWAELEGLYNPGMASHIRSGNVSGAAPGEFEAVVRKVHVDPDNGRKVGTLYVRYVSPEPEPELEIDAEPEWAEAKVEDDDNPFADFLPDNA